MIHPTRAMLPRLLATLSLVFAVSIPAFALDPKSLVQQMVHNEDEAATRKPHSSYVATERSERTGGHLWKERVAETTAGKIRFLIEEDGHPLSPDREASERGRLAAIVADPAHFTQVEHEQKTDESKAKAMLDLLPTAFVLEDLRQDGDTIHIDFHPDPAYKTKSMEEKVLHGMAGTLTIDTHEVRLAAISARLPQDVTLSLGLATVKAGSSFDTTRVAAEPGEWKTSTLDTDINGKALFFKSLGKNQHVQHSDFKRLPYDITVAQAVALVEQ